VPNQFAVCPLYGPSRTARNPAFRGRDEIDRLAGVIKATHLESSRRLQRDNATGHFVAKHVARITKQQGRYAVGHRVSGIPDKSSAYAGTDFVVARNARIASVYLFFDNLHLKHHYPKVFFRSMLTRWITPQRDEATRRWLGYLGFRKPSLGTPVFVEVQHPPLPRPTRQTELPGSEIAVETKDRPRVTAGN